MKNTKITILLLLTCCSIMQAQSKTSLKLSSSGKANYTIVKAASATKAEIYASEELSRYLNLVTKTYFRTINENKSLPAKKYIFVGQTDYAERKGIKFDDLSEEEWIIKTTDDGNLIITGGRPRGTLYGVYEFLESQVGCHWLAEKTEVIPDNQELAIPNKINIRDKPCFRIRAMPTYYVINKYLFQKYNVRNKCNFYPHADPKHKYMNNKLGFNRLLGRPGFCHTFYSYTKDWPKEYEKYYSLDKRGRRLIPTSSAGPGQVCLSNPEVRKLFYKKLKEFIKKDRASAKKGGWPAPEIYDISQNDGSKQCMCKECLKKAKKYKAYSGLLIEFINQIADDIHNDYPKVKIQTFAYAFSEKPPQNITARDNVIIRIALLGHEFMGYKHSIMKSLHSPENASTLQKINNWHKVCKNLSIWDYWIIFLDNVATPYIKKLSYMQDDFKFFKRNGVQDVFIENEKPEYTSFFELKRWFGFKMMQKPDQSEKKLLNIFMKGYYGKAAAAMTKYLRYLEAKTDSVKHFGKIPAVGRQYINWEFCVKSQALLDEAEKLVRDNPANLAHVQQERAVIDSIMLLKWDKFNKKLPFDKKAVIKRYRTNLLKSIEEYNRPSKWQKIKASNDIKIEGYKLSIPVPAMFKNTKCIDITWPYFCGNSHFRRHGVEMVSDKDAAGGKAAKLGNTNKKANSPDFHKQAFKFGIYDDSMPDGKSRFVPKSEIKQDGKYHFYKIERCNIHPKTYLWVHHSWQMQHSLTEAYNPAAPENIYDLYVSLKFQGPDYVKGDSKENAIFMDRIILVKSKKL